MQNDLKNKVLHIVCERNLCSYMNNTKWNELITAVKNEMSFPPAFEIRYVTQETDTESKIETEAVNYIGDWNGENFPPQEYYFNIEWIKVCPRFQKYRGKLIAPEVVDETKTFEKILDKCNIPFEEKGGLYCIYGYR